MVIELQVLLKVAVLLLLGVVFLILELTFISILLWKYYFYQTFDLSYV